MEATGNRNAINVVHTDKTIGGGSDRGKCVKLPLRDTPSTGFNYTTATFNYMGANDQWGFFGSHRNFDPRVEMRVVLEMGAPGDPDRKIWHYDAEIMHNAHAYYGWGSPSIGYDPEDWGVAGVGKGPYRSPAFDDLMTSFVSFMATCSNRLAQDWRLTRDMIIKVPFVPGNTFTRNTFDVVELTDTWNMPWGGTAKTTDTCSRVISSDRCDGQRVNVNWSPKSAVTPFQESRTYAFTYAPIDEVENLISLFLNSSAHWSTAYLHDTPRGGSKYYAQETLPHLGGPKGKAIDVWRNVANKDSYKRLVYMNWWLMFESSPYTFHSNQRSQDMTTGGFQKPLKFKENGVLLYEYKPSVFNPSYMPNYLMQYN